MKIGALFVPEGVVVLEIAVPDPPIDGVTTAVVLILWLLTDAL